MNEIIKLTNSEVIDQTRTLLLVLRMAIPLHQCSMVGGSDNYFSTGLLVILTVKNNCFVSNDRYAYPNIQISFFLC